MTDIEKNVLKNIEELIEKEKSKIRDMEGTIESYEDEITDMQCEIEDEEYKIQNLKKEAEHIRTMSQEMTRRECIEYIISDAPQSLQGQFFRAGWWNITDGYIWVDSVDKFEGAPEIEDPKFSKCAEDPKFSKCAYDNIKPKDCRPMPVEAIDPAQAETRAINNTLVVKVGEAWVQLWLIKLAVGIVGQPKCVECGGKLSPIAIESERGRALVLPVIHGEDEEMGE